MVRLGRRRSNELYAKFTSLSNDIKDTYANDTVGGLSLHGAAGPPLPVLASSELVLKVRTGVP